MKKLLLSTSEKPEVLDYIYIGHLSSHCCPQEKPEKRKKVSLSLSHLLVVTAVRLQLKIAKMLPHIHLSLMWSPKTFRDCKGSSGLPPWHTSLV
uniref:Uncharacterized protein MANES_14G004200 n=1 Tax=Rhizophora mucronata TaxID=61149 RepID=A0A2P2L1B2_RHIMU